MILPARRSLSFFDIYRFTSKNMWRDNFSHFPFFTQPRPNFIYLRLISIYSSSAVLMILILVLILNLSLSQSHCYKRMALKEEGERMSDLNILNTYRVATDSELKPEKLKVRRGSTVCTCSKEML